MLGVATLLTTFYQTGPQFCSIGMNYKVKTSRLNSIDIAGVHGGSVQLLRTCSITLLVKLSASPPSCITLNTIDWLISGRGNKSSGPSAQPVIGYMEFTLRINSDLS